MAFEAFEPPLVYKPRCPCILLGPLCLSYQYNQYVLLVPLTNCFLKSDSALILSVDDSVGLIERGVKYVVA